MCRWQIDRDHSVLVGDHVRSYSYKFGPNSKTLLGVGFKISAVCCMDTFPSCSHTVSGPISSLVLFVRLLWLTQFCVRRYTFDNDFCCVKSHERNTSKTNFKASLFRVKYSRNSTSICNFTLSISTKTNYTIKHAKINEINEKIFHCLTTGLKEFNRIEISGTRNGVGVVQFRSKHGEKQFEKFTGRI